MSRATFCRTVRRAAELIEKARGRLCPRLHGLKRATDCSSRATDTSCQREPTVLPTKFAVRNGENVRGSHGSPSHGRLFSPSLLPCRRGYCVDQNERNSTGLSAVVDPGVVGALLDEHIACCHMDF